ncbi:MAG: DUF4019 domain-containing protein [Myxococcota bacterium]
MKNVLLGALLLSAAVMASFQPAPAVAAEPAASNETEAQKAAEAWLAQVDGGSYGKSWEDAAPLFKGAVTREQWSQTVKAVRQPLGKVISRKLKSATYTRSVPGGPDGEYVIIQFDTVFANKKQAVETITPMRDKDGKWKVSGYFIK